MKSSSYYRQSLERLKRAWLWSVCKRAVDAGAQIVMEETTVSFWWGIGGDDANRMVTSVMFLDKIDQSPADSQVFLLDDLERKLQSE